MQKCFFVSFCIAVLVAGCSSGSDDSNGNNGSNEESAPAVDIAMAITTGADESSTEYWDCAFRNRDTDESGNNTVTFWENGRGITGGGSLYSWSLIDKDKLQGVYDSGERIFLFEQFEFSSGVDSFTALDRSTRNPDTEDEFTLLLDASCQRMG